MENILIRKEFILTKEDYNKVIDYINGDSFSLLIKDYVHKYNEYEWTIRFKAGLSNIIQIEVSIKDNTTSDTYKEHFSFLKPTDLLIPFKFDAKVGSKKVSFCFLFELETSTLSKEYYYDKKLIIDNNNSLRRAIDALIYLDFNDDVSLFAGLYHLLRVSKEAKKYLTTTPMIIYDVYIANDLSLVKEKFEYYGYNNDYIEEHKDSVLNVKNGSVYNYKDVFEYFITSALELLLNSSEDYIAETNKLEILYNFYYKSLKFFKFIA